MEEKIIRYPGVDLTVTYDVKRCIHAGECVRGLPEVFDPDRKPWVDPDRAQADDVAAVIRRCPTGALKYLRHDGGDPKQPPATTGIRVDPGGPLFARGRITVKNADGDVILKDIRMALCRCGASSNKPLCDGAHTRIGFDAPGALGEPKLKPVEGDEPPGVTILTARNGPLLLEGVVEIEGDGQKHVGRKCALCRCGSSSNKSYCDGTHKTIGFEA